MGPLRVRKSTASPDAKASFCPALGRTCAAGAPVAPCAARARHAYSAASAAIPTTVLGCTLKCVQEKPTVGCSRVTANIATSSLAEADGDLAEEEQERGERDDRDDQRAHEERAEELGVVLQVHVEHHHRGELHRRQDEERG